MRSFYTVKAPHIFSAQNINTLNIYEQNIFIIIFIFFTVELQWLELLWNHENMFKTGLVQANEC